MSKVEHIEEQVSNLSASELARFREWYAQFDGDAWDKQMEHDVAAGKLDAMADRAVREHRLGQTRSL